MALRSLLHHRSRWTLESSSIRPRTGVCRAGYSSRISLLSDERRAIQISPHITQEKTHLPPDNATTDIVQGFIREYPNQIKDWTLLMDRGMELCKLVLKHSKIEGIVSGRIKAHDSLRVKLRKRNTSGKWGQYTDIRSITHGELGSEVDIVGLRVALYFPAQQIQLIKAIKEQFEFISNRPFSRDWPGSDDASNYEPLFGRYSADHQWVRLRKKNQEDVGCYSDCPFEIQIRSVLMDAWAGISHKLLYKPQVDSNNLFFRAKAGQPSAAEQKLLDGVKGQVEVGEILIDLLFQVHQERIKNESISFTTIEDVRSVILEYIPEEQYLDVEIGDLSLLLRVLKEGENPKSKALRKGEFATPKLLRDLLRTILHKKNWMEISKQQPPKFDLVGGTLVYHLICKAVADSWFQMEAFSNFIKPFRLLHNSKQLLNQEDPENTFQRKAARFHRVFAYWSFKLSNRIDQYNKGSKSKEDGMSIQAETKKYVSMWLALFCGGEVEVSGEVLNISLLRQNQYDLPKLWRQFYSFDSDLQCLATLSLLNIVPKSMIGVEDDPWKDDQWEDWEAILSTFGTPVLNKGGLPKRVPGSSPRRPRLLFSKSQNHMLGSLEEKRDLDEFEIDWEDFRKPGASQVKQQHPRDRWVAQAMIQTYETEPEIWTQFAEKCISEQMGYSIIGADIATFLSSSKNLELLTTFLGFWRERLEHAKLEAGEASLAYNTNSGGFLELYAAVGVRLKEIGERGFLALSIPPDVNFTGETTAEFFNKLAKQEIIAVHDNSSTVS